MRQVQTECRTIVVVSSVVTNTPLRCPSAQWATATQPAGVPPGSPAGAVGGHRLASSDRPIRRSEPARPGDLLRLDLNNLYPIPTWRPPPPGGATSHDSH